MAGYCGALVAFPLAIAARKGTDWHRLSGRLFVGCFLVICITGYILNWDELLDLPLFRAWADPGGAQGFYNPSIDLAMRELVVLGPAAVNTFALYLALSGWRVWARRRALETAAPQHWWLLHLRKLAMAEAGLLAAVALRCAPSSDVVVSMLVSVLVVVIPTLLIIRSRLRTQQSD